MSDTWDFYFANVNDVIASLFVDLGIRDSAPNTDRPWLLWAWVYFREPRDDGLSGSEEAPILNDIEDALTEELEEVLGAELVGRITTAGRREFYFYGPRPDEFEEVVGRALSRFPEYEFDAGTQEDPDWSQYLNVLYPSPRDLQRIKNRHVLQVLEEHGDSLSRPRPVTHWSTFKTPSDRDEFIAAVVDAGFQVVDQSERDALEVSHPYGVTVERTDRVDFNSINEVTLELFQLSREANGDYDGWETSIEKDDGP